MYKIKIWDTEVEGEKLVLDHEGKGVCIMMDGITDAVDEDNPVHLVGYFGKGPCAQNMAKALLNSALNEDNEPIRFIVTKIMAAKDEQDYIKKLVPVMLGDFARMVKAKKTEETE